MRAGQRAKIASRELGIIVHRERAHLLPGRVAEKLAEKAPRQVWLAPVEAPPAGDDPYAGYEVPDDLIW